MRLFVLLLVLGNLLLFAWGRGYVGQQDNGREPERMARQLLPGALTIASQPPAAASETAAGAPLDGSGASTGVSTAAIIPPPAR